ACVGRLVAAHHYHHVHLFGQVDCSGLALGGGQADRVVGVHLAAEFEEAVDHVAHELLEPLGVLGGLRNQGDLAHLGGGRAARGQHCIYLLDALCADSPARTPATHFDLRLLPTLLLAL